MNPDRRERLEKYARAAWPDAAEVAIDGQDGACVTCAGVALRSTGGEVPVRDVLALVRHPRAFDMLEVAVACAAHRDGVAALLLEISKERDRMARRLRACRDVLDGWRTLANDLEAGDGDKAIVNVIRGCVAELREVLEAP